MTGRAFWLGVISIIILPNSLLIAEDNLIEDLNRCRSISNDDARLVCFDDIGKAPLNAAPQDIPSSPPEAEVADPVEYRVLSDDVGLVESEADSIAFLATISDCVLAPNYQFYFYFDNGQVWRYLGNKKLRYRECNLAAKITEDRMGYSMQIDGETRSLRIERVK
jgi:hypothetical protein